MIPLWTTSTPMMSDSMSRRNRSSLARNASSCRHRDDSHYKFVIRNSQFECAILLDSSARTVAAPALLMKRSNKLRLRWREVQMIIRGLASTRHVLLAHIIPMRRCNLACAYCNEYRSEEHTSEL